MDFARDLLNQQNWCPGPAVTDGDRGTHLVLCSLPGRHDGECRPDRRAFLAHSCEANGCTNPDLLRRYT